MQRETSEGFSCLCETVLLSIDIFPHLVSLFIEQVSVLFITLICFGSLEAEIICVQTPLTMLYHGSVLGLIHMDEFGQNFVRLTLFVLICISLISLLPVAGNVNSSAIDGLLVSFITSSIVALKLEHGAEFP